MNIILNNRTTNIDKDSISISELLIHQKFTFKMLVIQVNDVLIKKNQYDSTIVKDGDKVAVIHMISGG